MPSDPICWQDAEESAQSQRKPKTKTEGSFLWDLPFSWLLRLKRQKDTVAWLPQEFGQSAEDYLSFSVIMAFCGNLALIIGRYSSRGY
jgi:hypothetical protein